MAQYLDYTGLSHYDGKLKTYINGLHTAMWSDINTALNGKQTSNLITAWGNAGASATNTAYPSAKLVYDTIENLRATAEGKTNTFVIHMEYHVDGANDENAIFNTTNASVTFNISTGTEYFLMEATSNPTASQKLLLSSLKQGDVILVAEESVPDRWVERTSDNTIVFHKLETRSINLDSYLLIADATATYVPKTRTINTKALSADITLTGADIKATGSTNFNTSTINSALDTLAQSVSGLQSKVITTKGQIIYGNASGAATALSIGSNGKVLKVVSGLPSWENDSNSAHSHTVGFGLGISGAGGTSGETKISLGLARGENKESIDVVTVTALDSTVGNQFYPVRVDKSNNLGVYVPWENETNSAITTTTIDGLFTS